MDHLFLSGFESSAPPLIKNSMNREKLKERIESICNSLQEAVECEENYDVVSSLGASYSRLEILIERFDKEKWEESAQTPNNNSYE